MMTRCHPVSASWRPSGTLCLLISLLFIAFGPSLVAAQQEPIPKELIPTLHVVGEGTVSCPPDQAIVALGVTEQRESASEAQQRVIDHVARTIAALLEMNIEERHIRTTQLVLHPVYSQRPDSRAAVGTSDRWVPTVQAYRAEYGLQITVENLKMIGDILDRGLRAGVNRFDGITFGVQDEQAVRLAAMKAAAADARAQAQAIAGAMDLDLRGVLQLGNGSHTGHPPLLAGGPERTFRMADAAVAGDPVMAPGELTFHARLPVTYRLGSRP